MTDRVPTYPGRVTMTPVAGQTNKYDMAMADEPSVIGTPLNKASLLTDNAEEAIFGDANDRTVSDALFKLAGANNALRLVQKYTEAGAYTWACPADGDYIAYIIGGGGSGGIMTSRSTSNFYGASGGASGCVNVSRQTLTAGATKAVVVGAGGASMHIDTLNSVGAASGTGNNGGTSSFDGVTADGGEGGPAAQSGGNQAFGGQPSAVAASSMSPIGAPLAGGKTVAGYNDIWGAQAAGIPMPADEDGLPISCLCAGGTAKAGTGQTDDMPLANGKTCSPAVAGSSDGATIATVSPTDCGAGSGAITIRNSNLATADMTTGKGADGGVFIFQIMGAIL